MAKLIFGVKITTTTTPSSIDGVKMYDKFTGEPYWRISESPAKVVGTKIMLHSGNIKISSLENGYNLTMPLRRANAFQEYDVINVKRFCAIVVAKTYGDHVTLSPSDLLEDTQRDELEHALTGIFEPDVILQILNESEFHMIG